MAVAALRTTPAFCRGSRGLASPASNYPRQGIQQFHYTCNTRPPELGKRWSSGRPRGIAAASKMASSGDRYEEGATDYIAFDVKTPVLLRMGDDHPWNVKPTLVQTMMRSAVKECPDEVAIAFKERGADGPWTRWTYKEYLEAVHNVAKAFIALGLEETHAVGIMASTCAPWALSSLGAIFAGGLACGIYTTSNHETVAHICRNADVDILVLENIDLLRKCINGRSRLDHSLPGVKRVVLMESTESDVEQAKDACNAVGWSDLIMLGKQESNMCLKEREARQAVNKACIISYTSGTTSLPKGVMLSHDNVTFMAKMSFDHYQWGKCILLSYLPMSHAASHLLDCYCCINGRGTTYFADKDALKGTLVDNLKEVQPTRFLGVPRVWEKMKDKIEESVATSSPVKKAIMKWAMSQGRHHSQQVLAGKLTYDSPGSLQYQLADRLVLSKIHKVLGLRRTKLLPTSRVSGGSPIHHSTKQFFQDLGLHLSELYGLTETSGPLTTTLEQTMYNKLDSVGTDFPGYKTVILDPDPSSGEGEVTCYARSAFMGYTKEEAKTREAFTDDRLLRTGDLGILDSDGFLKITGRVKELIITQGGKNIGPLPIENIIKSQLLEIISQAVVVGDGKKFLTCLLTLKVALDPGTNAPTDRLDPVAKAWCKREVGEGKDVAVETVDDFRNGPHCHLLAGKIQAAIDVANSQAETHVAQVKKFTVLPNEFSVQGGEFGPTLKLRRFFIASKYEMEIDAMYNS